MTASAAQQFTAEERRSYLGASEIAAVMGLNKWSTPLDVYNSKLGLVPDFEGDQHTLRGQRLESVAADIFTEITGQKLRRKTSAYSHPQFPFIVGHIDRIVEGQKQIAEIKAPSVAAFRKYQREGLPEQMVIQMQMYLGLSGYPSGVWIIFCADQMEVATFEVEFDETIYQAAVTSAIGFWYNHVLAKMPPTVDAEAAIEIETHGGTVTRRDDEPFIAKSAALREAIELERDAAELKEIAKKEFIECIEDAPGIYEAPNLRVHYNLRPGRKSLDKKAMAAAGIDISAYEKTGSSYKEFRPYLINNSGEQQ